MNRRSFINAIITSAVAPLILPGAGRMWKRTEELYVPNRFQILYDYAQFQMMAQQVRMRWILEQKFKILRESFSNRYEWEMVLVGTKFHKQLSTIKE